MVPQEADARTILILFTIRSFIDRNNQLPDRRFPLYVVAEILGTENVDHARTAGADEVIETRKIGYSMIAHAVGYHGTAATMSRVVMSQDHNMYIGQIPDPPTEPLTFGELMLRLMLSKRGALVVGVLTPDGDEVINPPKPYLARTEKVRVYEGMRSHNFTLESAEGGGQPPEKGGDLDGNLS